ncbi:F-box/FBD/LRR-repeat protein At1g78750-like [Papaver somniferum]|uniref:F-box/FBD/LRR-repeat protein At1g78750-like n=1 Tax=Papaver somniferum TaxID=3469 RepID=UPI000E6FC537|nr:F-box/FBD/LRR-repeat protein At1g78750-like [Papaver somniferum]
MSRSMDSKTNKFMEFVDGTLHRRQENIQRLLICWDKHLNEERLNSWITSAVRHNVQQVRLNLTQDEPLSITLSLFTCESLVSLSISADVRFPNYISLPKLKRLELEGVEFSDENWNENHFSDCPALEIIRMENCIWVHMPYFCISTPTLKSFNIANWDDQWLPRGEDDGLGESGVFLLQW